MAGTTASMTCAAANDFRRRVLVQLARSSPIVRLGFNIHAHAMPLPLLQLVHRASYRGVAAWWAWGVVTSVSVVALLASATLHLRANERLAAVAKQVQGITAARGNNAPVAQQTESDFVQSMGVAPSTARVVQELKQASSLAGAALVSVQSQERLPTVDRLGNLELTVVLRGSYASNKQVLAHIVERFPFATVMRMRVRRGAGTPEVEMGATLVFWGGSASTGNVVNQ